MPLGQARDTGPAQPQAPWQLPEGYARLHRSFGWVVPAEFNMAQVCSQRWAAQPDAAQRVALRSYVPEGEMCCTAMPNCRRRRTA